MNDYFISCYLIGYDQKMVPFSSVYSFEDYNLIYDLSKIRERIKCDYEDESGSTVKDVAILNIKKLSKDRIEKNICFEYETINKDRISRGNIEFDNKNVFSIDFIRHIEQVIKISETVKNNNQNVKIVITNFEVVN